MKLGVQLYTARRLLRDKETLVNSLSEIKNIGYNAFQLYGNLDVLENLAKASRECGADIVGALVTHNEFLSEPGRLFDICERYSISDIGISSNLSECKNICEYIDKTNELARESRARGFSFSYHNHSHEYIKDEHGKCPMEYMLEYFSGDVDFMPDTYWLAHGGADIRRFLELTQGRVKILHLKDLKRTESGHTYTEVGYGNLYFEGIIKTALSVGIDNFVVEQDESEISPLVSLKKSYDYINKLFEGEN